MSLKNKIIGAVLASALVAPPAFAVEGSDGMHYTSASEGFYASIRAQFHSGGTEGDNSKVQNSGSRFGIQGTGEMSHGLEGFYRYEAAIGIDDGSGISTRMGHVGVRGGFGSLTAGTMWDHGYNWVYGATDLPNAGGGNFVYTARTSNSLLYTSPNFNGLQVAARFEMDGGNDKVHDSWVCDTDTTMPGVQGGTPATEFTPATGEVGLPDGTTETLGATHQCGADEGLVSQTVAGDDADLDVWSLTGKYEFNGFTLAGTYLNEVDAGLNEDDALEDKTSWAIRGGYGQDNWALNAWYGETNDSDFANGEKDSEVFSVSGSVTVGKTGVVVLHESMNGDAGDNTVTVLDIEYRLNSKAKTWVGYVARDNDANSAEDDYFNIGLRHDF